MSIIGANSYPISQLLDPAGKLVFEIPKYQREYTWGTSQLENLFDDLSDNSTGYFLGTIICINTSNDSINAPKNEVVDGQQRLTTLSILLLALYSSLQGYRDKMSEDQLSDLLQIKRKLVIKDTESKIRIVPQIQNNNLADYKALLAEQKVIPTLIRPANAKNRRVYRAFGYFMKRIASSVSEAISKANGFENLDDTTAMKTIFAMLEKVNTAIIVRIEVSSHAGAYTLFETLNNRGTPLTAVDLIKNLLLARIDLTGEKNLDTYFEQWQSVLEFLGDDYAIQERFFRHNYNAFRKSMNASFVRPDETKQYPLGIIATRSNLLDIYENIITKDPKKFLEMLIENAKIYSSIILQNIEGLSEALLESYLDLSRVQGAPSYLLLLYLGKEKTKLGISDEIIKKTVDLLVSFFVRRNLTDTPPTRDQTRIFMALIEEIENKDANGDDIYTLIRNKLLLASASDTAFEEKLRGQVYDDNLDATRFILCMMAKQGMTNETMVDLWKTTGSKQYTWTIEHIFPQGENVPESWVKMIAGGNSEKAKEYQAQYVHTFGNLTITGYNSILSNMAFLEKRDRKDNSGREIGYRNGLNLNADVVTEQVWTVDHIKARTNRMVTKILELFRM